MSGPSDLLEDLEALHAVGDDRRAELDEAPIEEAVAAGVQQAERQRKRKRATERGRRW